MNPSSIFSKTGKGVQEASGKTSLLPRSDRSVLAAIDGKTNLRELNLRFDKIAEGKFLELIQKLDKDGFIREVASAAAPQPATRTTAKVPPPKAPAAEQAGEELDFTQSMATPAPSRPAAPKPTVDLAARAREEAARKAQEEALSYKARQEAEARAKAEAEAKAKAAAEAKARAEAEAKARAEAEAKARAEAEAKARAEAAAKAKAAQEAAMRAAAEAKAKAEAEAARVKAEAEARLRKEAEEKARLQAQIEAERKAREEAERKAKEEAERRAKEAEQRARREAEEKAKREAEELRRKLEEERKAREAAERKAKEEAERRAKEAEAHARREAEEKAKREAEELHRKLEEERKAREEAERKAKREEERRRHEAEERAKEEKARAEREREERAREEKARAQRAREEEERARRTHEEEAARRAAATSPSIPVPPAAPAKPASSFDDSLLADLDSFGQKNEEERKAKEEADRKAKEEAARRAREEEERAARQKEEAQRREKEEARRRDEEERRRKEEAERQAREEEARRAREAEEQRRREEEERKRRAREEAARAPAGADEEVETSEEDLGMEDVQRDERAMSAQARKAAREREREAKRRKGEVEEAPAAAPAAAPRPPAKWGKPVAIALFVLLVAGLGALQVMPISTAVYEKLAAEAIGQPVRIGSARLSLFTGVELSFERVQVGETVRIGRVRATPDIGSLLGEKKSFGRMEMENAVLPQSVLGDALLGGVRSEGFRVARIVFKEVKLEGPVALPPLDAEAALGSDGSVRSVRVSGPAKLSATLTPQNGEVAFDVSSSSFAFPFAPDFGLSDFAMKGTASRGGLTVDAFDGKAFEGVFSGKARVSWGANWRAEGELQARGINAGVLAPALVSEGRGEGKGTFSMNGADPGKLYQSAHLEGTFAIQKGVLGSFDLSRAIQTGGAQATGRTLFAELSGQGSYDKGAVALRNVTISAGALNGGASADIDASGALSGRIVAEVKTSAQTLRATLNLGGTAKEPQIRR